MNLSANKILDELKKCGITHIVHLPDSDTQFIYDEMMERKDISVVMVCREGEALPVALGLFLGGKKPVLLHQNTGLTETGDSLRLGIDMGMPLLILVGYRGWRFGETLTDSAAIFTSPFLDAFGIKSYLVEKDEDIGLISKAYEEATNNNKQVAVLIASGR